MVHGAESIPVAFLLSRLGQQLRHRRVGIRGLVHVRLPCAIGMRSRRCGCSDRAGEPLYAALLETIPDAPIELRIDVAISRAAAGINFVPGLETISALEAVLDQAERLGDPDVLAHVYALLLRVRTMLDENYGHRSYRELMNRAYALAPQVTEPGLRAVLEGMMGQALRAGDRYEEAVRLTGGAV